MEIESEEGKTITNPQEINSTFQTFYSKLYTSETPATSHTIHSFLDQIEIPVLTESTKNELNSPTVACELSEAIDSMTGGKAPGPDGIPIEIYQSFKGTMLVPLLNMCEECLEKRELPPSLQNALITLISKPEQPSTKCESYRPFSLINNHVKIIAKVLARRLERHLSTAVALDQNGFIEERQGSHNIHRLMNIIYAKKETPDMAVIGLDVEKAFDRVEHEYLSEVLNHFGIGGYFP